MITLIISNLIYAQKPDFIIIGAQKAGTTSLNTAITLHRQIKPPIFKELHFFDWYFSHGVQWYENWFPKLRIKGTITGEATPNYLFTHNAPQKIHKLYPNIKIIVILRNPIDRAWSQYMHAKNQNLETRTFKECITYEIEQFNNGNAITEETHPRNANVKNLLYKSHPIYKHPKFCASLNSGYLERGIYAHQLENWFKYFDRSQFLILSFEELISNQSASLQKIFKFLKVRPNKKIQLPRENSSGNIIPPIDAETLKILHQFYQPYNKKLETMLNRTFNWN